MDRYLTGKRKKTGDARQWNMAVKSNKKEEAYLALKFTVNVEQKFKLRFSCTTETCFFFIKKQLIYPSGTWMEWEGLHWFRTSLKNFGKQWFDSIFKQKCQRFASSSSLNMRICCFSLFYIIVYLEYLAVGQTNKATRRSHIGVWINCDGHFSPFVPLYNLK